MKHICNASIMGRVAGCGLSSTGSGGAVSIVFFTPTWRPDSFYDRIKENAQLGLHTLLLLDIRVKEPSVEALCEEEGYEPPRFIVRDVRATDDGGGGREGEKVYGPDSMCVAVARMGQDDEVIKSCTLKEMCNIDVGALQHGARRGDASARKRHARNAPSDGKRFPAGGTGSVAVPRVTGRTGTETAPGTGGGGDMKRRRGGTRRTKSNKALTSRRCPLLAPPRVDEPIRSPNASPLASITCAP